MAGNLRLESYSDRELLHVVADVAREHGNDGWVDVDLIADRIGMARNGLREEQHALHVRRCVSVRLSWVARLSGAVERRRLSPGAMSQWRLTDDGHAVVKATLSPKMVADLENGVKDYQALVAIEALGRRYQKAGTSQANLLRRQWVHGTHRARRSA